jgi:uncharacterized surface protein with fasciclin (FAS1) repeats
MRLTRRLTVAVASLAMASTAVLAAAPTATAHQTGDTPLAELLLADGDTFDHNQYDYDILTQAVLAVLAAKPDSAVGVLTDGSVPLTAFLPTDKAFKRTVKELTGSWPRSERRTFAIVAGLGIDTVETVLLYHVVPGVTIDSAAALASDGAALTTAAGPTFTVDVFTKANGKTAVRLLDGARPYPYLVLNRLDINAGNNQIGHRITRLLLPPA